MSAERPRTPCRYSFRRRGAWMRRVVGECRCRAALSEPHDQAGRSVCRRRANRHHRAGDRRQAVEQPQAAIRDRESARRGRQHRNRSRRQGGARRLYAGARGEHDADRESKPLQEDAVRPGQGHQTNLDRFGDRSDAGRASVRSGPFGDGVRRLRGGGRHRDRSLSPMPALATERQAIWRWNISDCMPASRQSMCLIAALRPWSLISWPDRSRSASLPPPAYGARARGATEGPRRVARQPFAARTGRADNRRVGLCQVSRSKSYSVLLAPAGIPAPIAALLEREVQAALELPEMVERFRLMDTSPVGMIGAEVGERLKAEREAWSKVVAAANLRLD